MKKLLLITLLLVYNKQVNAQYSNLFDFSGVGNNGAGPFGSLITDGTYLYGMTYAGGTHNLGVIFKILPNGTGYDTLHCFGSNTNDGNTPVGSLYYDGTYLYGMTSTGGTNNACTGGCGTIFKVKPDATGYTVLLNFTNAAIGSAPLGSLISDGTFLYGMTSAGGAYSYGTAFKIMPNGTGYLKLHDFGSGTDGNQPHGDLYYDGNYLYGMTYQGGTNSVGVIFKIKPDGTGYLKLHDFAVIATDGAYPYGSLISDGTYLFGMTTMGGADSVHCGGGIYCGGTVFKIKPDGTSFDTLKCFSRGNGSSQSSFIYDGTFLYGMTIEGAGPSASSCYGTIFKIMPNGSGYNSLHCFGNNNTDGGNPYGNLLLSGGCLYGMTYEGGSNSGGTVFSLCGVAGIEQFANNNEQVNIYPNPNNGSFIIEPNNATKQTMQVYDVNGKMVLSQTINSKTIIDASSLSEGVYNISIISTEGITNKKLVIVR